MKSLTKEERRAVARRIFEALCEHYPDRYIALDEQPVNVDVTAAAAQSASEIADLGVNFGTPFSCKARTSAPIRHQLTHLRQLGGAGGPRPTI